MCEALRPASVLAKTLATLDRICDGRLDVGLGAGWYEPDYTLIGMDVPVAQGTARAPARGDRGVPRLVRAADRSRSTGATTARSRRTEPSRARCSDRRRRSSSAAKGDRLLALVAELADGWNTCWVWTPDAYRERLGVLERACEAIGRDPATVTRSLGLYALCGEDEADLARRFERLRALSPPGVLDAVTLDEWREGRLVGTVEQVREQAAGMGGPRHRDAGGGDRGGPVRGHHRRRRRTARRRPSASGDDAERR